MAWPTDPLDVEVGLFIDGAWVDAVTTGDGVLHSDEIHIRHGRSDWASIADPSRASFTLANRDGRWSPDNPDSPYFGSFRRNIPCRIGIGRGETHLAPTGVSYDLASTPDHSSLDPAGNLDLRIEFEAEQDYIDTTKGGSLTRLVHKTTGTTGWGLSIYDTGGEVTAAFGWYDNGGTFRQYDTNDSGSDLPPDFRHEHRALRLVLTVSTGTLTWYTSTTLDGTWTQLGSPCTGVGATTISATTADLKVGGHVGDTRIPFPGRIYGFQMRDGATLVADAAFNDQAVGATSWTDAAGRTWTVGSGGRITNMLWRFHGELSSIPTRWNIDGSDVWAPVEATGLFRRLRQGNRRLDSSLRRGLLARANSAFGSDLVAYWPLEEQGQDLTAFGAAVGGGPMVVSGDTPSTGSYTGFQCSGPLPTLGDSVLTAAVDTYTPATEWQVRWLQFIPGTATSSGAWFDVMRITTTVLTWVVQWQDTSSGNMRVLAYNSGGTLVYTGGAIGMAATGQAFRVSLAVYSNGSNVDLDFQAQVAGGVPGGVVVSNAVTSTTPGRVTQIKVNEDANLDDWAFGHITLQNNVTPTTEMFDELNAYNGEQAANRIVRLCREEGIATRIEGDPADTEAMGPQRAGTLMGLLEQCAATDLGVLHESRETVAVGYRTRSSMTNQPVYVALDYAAGEVTRSPDLDRDDDGFANDITLENASGAEARAVLDDGSVMSISEPPVGAGRYQTSVAVNLYADTRLPLLAAAYLALSSVDEPRVSQLTLGMHHAALAADIALMSAIFDAQIGDPVSVANPLPVALGASGSILQLIQGWSERISSFEHELVLTTSPGTVWETDPLPAPPPATYPVLESTTTSATNAPGTSHTIQLDGADSAGQLLLAWLMFNADTTITGMTGWTALSSNTASPGRSAVYGKIATGSEGSSISATTSSSNAGAFIVQRISNNSGGLVAGTDYTVAVASAATTANPNPPSVTAGWGSDDNLFIAACCVRGDNDTVTAYPTNYTGEQRVTTNGGGGGATVGVAVRQLTSATDDPDTFTLSASEYGRAYTIVIRPA